MARLVHSDHARSGIERKLAEFERDVRHALEHDGGSLCDCHHGQPDPQPASVTLTVQ